LIAHSRVYASDDVKSSSQASLKYNNRFKLTKLYIAKKSFKKSFYRAANAIFGKVGRHASEEVILQLISSKCMCMCYCVD